MRFPGQYADLETRYSDNYYRDYDPSLGRYIQSDPIGIIEDYSNPQLKIAINSGIFEESNHSDLNHLYGYVEQNPYRYSDPFGLICLTCIAQGNGGGNGRRDESGGKMCNYECTAPNGDSNILEGGSKDYGNGNYICYGANVNTGVSPGGDTYPYANGFGSFEIDTDSWWDSWQKPTLINNAKEVF